jgi:uncharacterized damage-inducible protein DinB
MRRIDVFLLQLDGAWQHRWESLAPLLDGITEEEARWQAPCYRMEPEEQPKAGTIHGQVEHLIRCKREYTAAIRRVPPGRHAPAATFRESVGRLLEAHRAEREAIASLADGDLDLPAEGGMSVAEFLASIIRHDIWHAAQIAVARRLWRTRA